MNDHYAETMFLCLYGGLMFIGGACFAWFLDALDRITRPKLKHDWKRIAEEYERGELPLFDEESTPSASCGEGER